MTEAESEGTEGARGRAKIRKTRIRKTRIRKAIRKAENPKTESGSAETWDAIGTDKSGTDKSHDAKSPEKAESGSAENGNAKSREAENGSASSGNTQAGGGPADAFEQLYTRHAADLNRQTYLLTGDRRIAERSVAYAYRVSWERWPEVAVDADPAGWVRAVAHDYALSPWHQLLPRRHRRTPRPGTAGAAQDREMLEALLSLPPSYRRTLLLHDGVGIGLPETAVETEASPPAAAGRLEHAREALTERLPVLRTAPPEKRRALLNAMLDELAAGQPVRQWSGPEARKRSERVTQQWVRMAIGLPGLLAAAVGLTVVTAQDNYTSPPPAPATATAPDRHP